MTSTQSLAYRKAAVQHASTVGLVIALYDTLLGNLSRAADAMDRNDIQSRCAELVHAFKVLQQLELMVDIENGGETAIKLRRFYAHTRNQMLEAQFKILPSLLRDQIQALMKVREAWHIVDTRGVQVAQELSTDAVVKPDQNKNLLGQFAAEAEVSRSAFSCSV
jgi:flagellar protein FliS